jgi:type I restriction enzyme R subunit
MPDTPAQRAPRCIDKKLDAVGWLVRGYEELDLPAGAGIAVSEFPMAPTLGVTDYLLYLDRKAIGAIEVKESVPLSVVESESAKYPSGLPARHRPSPFLSESDGSATHSTNGLDPIPRGRRPRFFQARGPSRLDRATDPVGCPTSADTVA